VGAFKEADLYPFLVELKSGHKRIKEEIEKIEETIINNTGDVKLIEYPNKSSMLYKNKSWKTLFAIAQQGKMWHEFMSENKFIPGIGALDEFDLVMTLQAIKKYYKTAIPYTENLLSELFKKNKDQITNIYIVRLDGNKGELPLHTNYDPHMYRCHFGVLVPHGDIGIEVDGTKKIWEEGETLIFDSMQPHRVWNNTGKARYIVLIDCFRPEPSREETRAVHKLLVEMRMRRDKNSNGLSGGTSCVDHSKRNVG
jgi:hypothetical protein